MLNTYFLGGASPAGFITDFWEEHRQYYGILLKGGPGTGKSTLMKRIAAAFSGEDVSVYHCASDPDSLDAVVLETRHVFLADATAPHEAGTPLPAVSGELTDLAATLEPAAMRESAEAVRTLYAANQAAHLLARKGLAGIAAMEEQITLTGRQALLTEKLSGYAHRLAKRILPKKHGSGRILYRQRTALTPAGKLAYLPEHAALMLLDDPARTASGRLLQMLAETAAAHGQTAELTRSLTQNDCAPVMLVLPEQSLVLADAAVLPQTMPAKPECILRLRRFYDPEVLRTQRTLLRFCAKTAAAAEAQTAAILADALRIHDALESHYIRVLDTDFLNRTAESLKARILHSFPAVSPAD